MVITLTETCDECGSERVDEWGCFDCFRRAANDQVLKNIEERESEDMDSTTGESSGK